MSTTHLPQLAALPSVAYVRIAHEGTLRIGSATTEGDAASGADRARSTGYDGSGVVVGVISDGIDHLANAQGSGDLGDVSVPPRCHAGRGDEGTALLEIVHDVAPGARLLFAGGLTSGLGFVEALRCLVEGGADVVVDDLAFFDEPFFEDGSVAAAARAAVSSGVSYHTAAGNEAGVHLEQDYRAAPGSDFHDFLGGPVDETNDMFIPPFGELFCVLQWDNPFGGAGDDYDLLLMDDRGTLIDAGMDVQDGRQDPIEFVAAENPTAFSELVKVAVRKHAGADRRLKMFCPGAIGQQYTTERGSIFGQAAVSEVVAVAAMNVREPRLDAVESFSSHGPATILFPVPATRAKPDVTAFDGVSISNAGGFPSCPPACRFFGTSAAAPHAAGVAALLLAKNPFLTPAAIQALLRSSAVDVESPGIDDRSGAGRLDALAAVTAVPSPECRRAGDCDDADNCTIDACDAGACRHAAISCAVPAEAVCAATRCDPQLGCVTAGLSGLAGSACWLRMAVRDIAAADRVALFAGPRRRLTHLVDGVLSGVSPAEDAIAAGSTKRARRMLERSTRRLRFALRLVQAAGRRGQIARALADSLRTQIQGAADTTMPVLDDLRICCSRRARRDSRGAWFGD